MRRMCCMTCTDKIPKRPFSRRSRFSLAKPTEARWRKSGRPDCVPTE